MKEVKRLTNGDLNLGDLTTPKNIAIATGLFGFWLGTRTPGYMNGKLEAFGRQMGSYIQQGLSQQVTQPGAYVVQAAQADPLERLYQVVTVLTEKNEQVIGQQGEILELLRDYVKEKK